MEKEDIEVFLDALLERVKEEYHRPLMPYQVYAEHSKELIRKELDEYAERLRHGFSLLLEKDQSLQNPALAASQAALIRPS